MATTTDKKKTTTDTSTDNSTNSTQLSEADQAARYRYVNSADQTAFNMTDADAAKAYRAKYGSPASGGEAIYNQDKQKVDAANASLADVTGANKTNAATTDTGTTGTTGTGWSGGTYSQQLSDTLNKILNMEDFSYDMDSDQLYQQYKNQYTREGKQAMQDTIGQAAALTGGYGNSYAEAAGEASYQSYLDQLNDKVPELYQLAYNQYQDKVDNLYNQANLLNNLNESDYSKYRDTVSDSQWQTEFDYQKSRDETSDSQWQQEFDYQKSRDEASDNQWQQEFEYQKSRDEVSDSQWQQEFDQEVKQQNWTNWYTQQRDSVEDQQWAAELAQDNSQFLQSLSESRYEFDTDQANTIADTITSLASTGSSDAANAYINSLGLDTATQQKLQSLASKTASDSMTYLQGVGLDSDSILSAIESIAAIGGEEGKTAVKDYVSNLAKTGVISESSVAYFSDIGEQYADKVGTTTTTTATGLSGLSDTQYSKVEEYVNNSDAEGLDNYLEYLVDKGVITLNDASDYLAAKFPTYVEG